MLIPDKEVAPCHNYLSVLSNVGSQRNQGRQRASGADIELVCFVGSEQDAWNSAFWNITGQQHWGMRKYGTRTRTV